MFWLWSSCQKLSIKSFKKKVNLNLTISTRENSSIKKLGDFEFENLEFKENTYDKKILDKLNEYDYILISVPPINSNDLFLKNLANHLKDHDQKKSIKAKKIVKTSEIKKASKPQKDNKEKTSKEKEK